MKQRQNALFRMCCRLICWDVGSFDDVGKPQRKAKVTHLPLSLHEVHFMISLMKCRWPKAISPSVSVRKCRIPGDLLLANLIWKAHRLTWMGIFACTTLSFTIPISRVHILHLSCVHMDLQSTHFPLWFTSRPSYATFCLDWVLFPHILTPKVPSDASCSANTPAPAVHRESPIVRTAQVPRRHGKSCSLSPALEPDKFPCPLWKWFVSVRAMPEYFDGEYLVLQAPGLLMKSQGDQVLLSTEKQTWRQSPLKC